MVGPLGAISYHYFLVRHSWGAVSGLPLEFWLMREGFGFCGAPVHRGAPGSASVCGNIKLTMDVDSDGVCPCEPSACVVLSQYLQNE
jgi:hypothetical protein